MYMYEVTGKREFTFQLVCTVGKPIMQKSLQEFKTILGQLPQEREITFSVPTLTKIYILVRLIFETYDSHSDLLAQNH